jgi:hypothetical protein
MRRVCRVLIRLLPVSHVIRPYMVCGQFTNREGEKK